mgnify:FL=1
MEPITERLAPMVHQTPEAGNASKAEPRETAPEAAPSPRPAGDRYEPEDPQEPIGLYRVERDEEGNPKVRFDDPEAGKEPPEPEESSQPEKEKKGKITTCDTSRVDREIEALKKRREQLKRQLESAADPQKAQKLEQKLAQVEAELTQKDNDAYRRQNAVYS